MFYFPHLFIWFICASHHALPARSSCRHASRSFALYHFLCLPVFLLVLLVFFLLPCLPLCPTTFCIFLAWIPFYLVIPLFYIVPPFVFPLPSLLTPTIALYLIVPSHHLVLPHCRTYTPHLVPNSPPCAHALYHWFGYLYLYHAAVVICIVLSPSCLLPAFPCQLPHPLAHAGTLLYCSAMPDLWDDLTFLAPYLVIFPTLWVAVTCNALPFLSTSFAAGWRAGYFPIYCRTFPVVPLVRPLRLTSRLPHTCPTPTHVPPLAYTFFTCPDICSLTLRCI